MHAATTETPLQAYARELGLRVWKLVGVLRIRIFNGMVDQPWLIRDFEPLLRRISRAEVKKLP